MHTILITGANRGLGLGLTRHYLERGWRVIAAARDPSTLDALSSERLLALQLDVADAASIAAAAEAVRAEALDVLINNAGVSLPEASDGEWAEIYAKTFAVNATGPALMARAFAPLMSAGGKLINMSSGMGSLELNINPAAGLDAYGMSKAALNMLSRHLAEQWRGRGRIVVAMSPGWVRTDMGGSEATSSVGEAVASLSKVIDGLTLADAGKFLAQDGGVLPW